MNLLAMALLITALGGSFNTALEAKVSTALPEYQSDFDINAYLRTFKANRHNIITIDHDSNEAILLVDKDFALIGSMNGEDFIAHDVRISPEGQKRLSTSFQLFDIQNRPFQELSKTDVLAIVCIMFRLSTKMLLACGKTIFDQCKRGACAVAKRLDDDLRRGWEKQREKHPWMWDLSNA
ncbi:hypothetical protein FJ365_03865 [Candidatus Dependentiae bacterium]|nr:hypothetical protein [Candidatus Dependentiae bacterium]